MQVIINGLISGLVSAVLIVVFLTWLKRHKIGIRFKALSDNPTELALIVSFTFNKPHRATQLVQLKSSR